MYICMYACMHVCMCVIDTLFPHLCTHSGVILHYSTSVVCQGVHSCCYQGPQVSKHSPRSGASASAAVAVTKSVVPTAVSGSLMARFAICPREPFCRCNVNPFQLEPPPNTFGFRWPDWTHCADMNDIPTNMYDKSERTLLSGSLMAKFAPLSFALISRPRLYLSLFSCVLMLLY